MRLTKDMQHNSNPSTNARVVIDPDGVSNPQYSEIQEIGKSLGIDSIKTDINNGQTAINNLTTSVGSLQEDVGNLQTGLTTHTQNKKVHFTDLGDNPNIDNITDGAYTGQTVTGTGPFAKRSTFFLFQDSDSNINVTTQVRITTAGVGSRGKSGTGSYSEWKPIGSDNNYTDEDKEKVDKLVINGDGTKYLGDDGNYKEVPAGGIEEAPKDDNLYVRWNEIWVSIGRVVQLKSYSSAYSSAYPAVDPTGDPYIYVPTSTLDIVNEGVLQVESNTNWDIT